MNTYVEQIIPWHISKLQAVTPRIWPRSKAGNYIRLPKCVPLFQLGTVLFLSLPFLEKGGEILPELLSLVATD